LPTAKDGLVSAVAQDAPLSRRPSVFANSLLMPRTSLYLRQHVLKDSVVVFYPAFPKSYT